MFDKARNHLIACAFRKANITSLESDPTPAEIEDAAHTLNTMLQSWNNDGFRLFKMKTGYMPFIPNTNEYSLKTQAYKSIESQDIVRIDRIGATNIQLDSMINISVGQRIIAVDNIATSMNTIESINFADRTVMLAEPLDFSVYSTTAVFYGNFNTALTSIQTFDAAFNTLPFNEYSVAPAVGDTVYFCYNGVWTKKTISLIDSTNKTFSFSGGNLPAGSITNQKIVYGTNVFQTTLSQDYSVEPRRVVLRELAQEPKYIAIPVQESLGDVFEVEKCDLSQKTVILTESLSEDALYSLMQNKIEADKNYLTQKEVDWSDLIDLVPVTELDWGSVADSSDLQTDDWGMVTDTASVLLDWGTLTGSAVISGYSESDGVKYVLATDGTNDTIYMFYNEGSGWQEADLSSYGLGKYNLYTFGGHTYLYDETQGVFVVNRDLLTQIYSVIGVEKIIMYKGKHYLVSPKHTSTIIRDVCVTQDFTSFANTYEMSLDSLENPAEFQERLFIGSTDTYVGDMIDFMNANVYSQHRCVIGDRLINLNMAQNCSYTLDGVHFYPMPMMLSNQTAWGAKYGCAFIAVYGVLHDGIVSTQIYTANDFNPVWTPQVIVPGRVFDIFFDEQRAYFVSDIAVYSLLYNTSIEPIDSVSAYCFGEQIGRPQELMNVMKFSFSNMMQLPMNALALKDFLLLPHDQLNGEPVNYCFMREAEDGKMMIWGTPNKFGEYLRFTYVEPITLLEGARSTPDFPDEYYEAVEDGLAFQLAAQYGAPIERQKELAARAQESKENAMLHDNEDTSYNIVPNQRWL